MPEEFFSQVLGDALAQPAHEIVLDIGGDSLDEDQDRQPENDKPYDARIIWFIILGLPVLVLIKTVAAYIQNYLMSWLGQRITQDLREELFRHIHVLGLDFLAENKSGDILARVTNDLNTVQSTLNFTPLYLVRDSLTVV